LILQASERIKELVENESALLSQTWAASHVAGMLCWLGHSARAMRLLERLEPFVPVDAPPSLRINYMYVCASVLTMHGAAQKALSTTRGALDLAQETGILAFNGPLLVQRAAAALVAGEVDIARDTLARFIASTPPPTPPVIKKRTQPPSTLNSNHNHARQPKQKASAIFRPLRAETRVGGYEAGCNSSVTSNPVSYRQGWSRRNRAWAGPGMDSGEPHQAPLPAWAREPGGQPSALCQHWSWLGDIEAQAEGRPVEMSFDDITRTSAPAVAWATRTPQASKDALPEGATASQSRVCGGPEAACSGVAAAAPSLHSS